MKDPSTSADDSDLIPQIKQKVTGYNSQVIGNMRDSIAINNLNITIDGRIPAKLLPPSASMLPILTPQECKERQTLLSKVESRVKKRLAKSLHTIVSIELGLQERPDLVQQDNDAEFADVPGQVLPQGTQVTEIFDRTLVERTLAIFGEPGAGKTIVLLKLVEEIIIRTNRDLRQPIPVIFNLSSWGQKPQTLEQWLVQELDEKYKVSQALGKAWVKTQALILFLDGLDEVKADRRNACVQALNDFMKTHFTTEIVVCCRIRDYEKLPDRLSLRSAICIQPLSTKQIDEHLDRAGEQLSGLKTILPQDAVLQELATTPLLLSIMSLTYKGCTSEEIPLGGSLNNYRRRLFANYVDEMFKRRVKLHRNWIDRMLRRWGKKQPQYRREDTERWLIWLAQRMKTASQSEFLIEGLQPICLSSSWQQILYRFGTGIFCGLSLWAIFTMFFGSSIGLSSGISYTLINFLQGEIKTVETLTLEHSWKESQTCSLYGFLTGTIFALILISINGNLLEIKSAFDGIVLSGIFGGMTGAMVGIFRGAESQNKENSNEGIIRSAKNATIIFFVTFISFGIFAGLQSSTLSDGLISGLSLGIVTGLIYGGNTCIRHFIIRLFLYCQGLAPWNYAHFLDYATEQLFLQKVGGAYIFIHRMLLEHFAEMSIEQGKR